MNIPVATYRVQFSKDFRFEDARGLTPYLRALGISHLYASPILKARSGSTHGYDVTDPRALDPELGTEAEFEALHRALAEAGLSILLDVVPNHMAASPENPWWMDLLENGPASVYASYFDVAWEPSETKSGDKVLLPILGSAYGTVLENGELKPAIDETGVHLRYHAWKLPFDPSTYLEALDGIDLPALNGFFETLGRLPARTATEWEALETRTHEAEAARRKLWNCYRSDPEVRDAVDRRLAALAGVKGDPRSFDKLDRLLQQQPYVIAIWRAAREKINYRRFFDVSELVGVRAELAEVHEATHGLIYDLMARGAVSGLRIDHIDGLYDPQDYLDRLQARQPGLYVVVEKIISSYRTAESVVREDLPDGWQTCGTSGYDFLGAVNNLFVDPVGLETIAAGYKALTGVQDDFDETAYREKKRVMADLFTGEISALTLHLGAMAEHDRHARDLSPSGLRDALVEVTACLPVYRTYTRSIEVSERDRALVAFAIGEARRRNPGMDSGLFDFLQRLLLLEFPQSLSEEQRAEWVRFVMRWQQMSGPITAKGVEDTALYNFNRLISMNEVGGSPYPVSIEEFHRLNEERRQRWHCALNATSTHDTKRSEDVRCRLNVLSESAADWVRLTARWRRWNQPLRREIGGAGVPDANEELLIYQTLIGAWPLPGEDGSSFRERLHGYLVKASREAKVHTSWLHPDEEYERALLEFLDGLLENRAGTRFLDEFQRLERRTAFYGAVNSLSQTLLKVASPGVPDFYQSTAVWDLSLVDPDNRRPVDFPARIELLERLKRWEANDLLPLIRELLNNWTDGAVKAFLTYRSLEFRRRDPKLFVDGEYVPLTVEGERAGHAVTFLRRLQTRHALAVAPRLVAGFSAREVWPLGRRAWRDSAVRLPDGAPVDWRNVLTGERLEATAGRLSLQAVLSHFPVALLAAG